MTAFADVLFPFSPRSFLTEVWGKHAQSSRLPGRDFRGLLRGADLADVFARAAALPLTCKIGYRTAEGVHRELGIDPRAALAHLDAGMTVCMQRIQRILPGVAELVQDAKREVRTMDPCSAGLYVSPHGAGFGLHFDDAHVFLLQVEGAKHWRYGRGPTVPCPPCSLIASNAESFRDLRPWATPDPHEPLEETLLEPGDVLYLPPGTWHAARAEGRSVGVTLHFDPLTAEELWRPWTRRVAEADLAYRRSPAALPRAGRSDGVPEAALAVLRAQRDSLRASLATLDDAALAELWLTRVHRQDPAPRPRAETGFLPEARFVRALDLHVVAQASASEGSVAVWLGPQQHMLHPAVVALLACLDAPGKTLTEIERFAETLPIAGEALLPLLSRLHRQGLVLATD